MTATVVATRGPWEQPLHRIQGASHGAARNAATQPSWKATSWWHAKEAFAMEYLVTMTTHVPEGTVEAAVQEIRDREAAHSRGPGGGREPAAPVAPRCNRVNGAPSAPGSCRIEARLLA